MQWWYVRMARVYLRLYLPDSDPHPETDRNARPDRHPHLGVHLRSGRLERLEYLLGRVRRGDAEQSEPMRDTTGPVLQYAILLPSVSHSHPDVHFHFYPYSHSHLRKFRSSGITACLFVHVHQFRDLQRGRRDCHRQPGLQQRTNLL